MSLELDMSIVWTAINSNIPMFFDLYAPVIGISAALAIVGWIGAKIVGAFRGGDGGF